MKNQNSLAIIIIGGGLVMAVVIFYLLSLGKKPAVKAGNSAVNSQAKSDFLGEKGKAVKAVEGKIYIDEEEVNDGNMHNFNYFSEKEAKTIYFFIVRASDRSYRVAADACEVCFDSRKGFKQVGGEIRCENCRTIYSKDQIALEKGGCNPRPIDKNAQVVNGKLLINAADVEQSADLF